MTVSIEQSKKWLEQVVIGYNFCPFAKREFLRNSIAYELITASKTESVLRFLLTQIDALEKDSAVETVLIILEGNWNDFYRYLELYH